MNNCLPVYSPLIDSLRSAGFVDADQIKDIGSIVSGLVYVRRVFNGQWQYLAITHYQGAFCECLFEVYLKEKNTRAPKNQPRETLNKGGFAPVFWAIYRTPAEALAAINLSYG